MEEMLVAKELVLWTRLPMGGNRGAWLGQVDLCELWGHIDLRNAPPNDFRILPEAQVD